MRGCGYRSSLYERWKFRDQTIGAMGLRKEKTEFSIASAILRNNYLHVGAYLIACLASLTAAAIPTLGVSVHDGRAEPRLGHESAGASHIPKSAYICTRHTHFA
jgi:hypothetical protein